MRILHCHNHSTSTSTNNRKYTNVKFKNQHKKVNITYSGVSRFDPDVLNYIKQHAREDAVLKIIIKKPGIHRSTVEKVALKTISDIFSKIDDKDIYQRTIKVDIDKFSPSELDVLHTCMPQYEIKDPQRGTYRLPTETQPIPLTHVDKGIRTTKTAKYHPMRIVKNNGAKFATHSSPLRAIQFRNVKFNRHHTKVQVKSYCASGFNADVRRYVATQAKNTTDLKFIIKDNTQKKITVQAPLKDALHVLDKVGDKNIHNGMIFLNIADFSIAELNTLHKLMPTYAIVDAAHKVIISHHPDLFTYPGYIDFTVLNLFTQPVKLCIPHKPIDKSDLEKRFDFFVLDIQPEKSQITAIEQYPFTLTKNATEILTTLKNIFPNFSCQAIDLEHNQFHEKGCMHGILKKIPTTHQHATLLDLTPQLPSNTTKITFDASGNKVAIEGTYSFGIVDDLYDITKTELQSILSHPQEDDVLLKIIRRERSPAIPEEKKKRGNLQPQCIEKTFSLNEVRNIIKKVGYSNINEEKHCISLSIKDFTLHELQILHDLMPSFDFRDQQYNLMIPYKQLPQTKRQRSMCNLALFERFDSLFPGNIFLVLPDMGDIRLQCSEKKKTITISPSRPHLLLQSEITLYISLIQHLFPHYQLQSADATVQSLIALSSVQ